MGVDSELAGFAGNPAPSPTLPDFGAGFPAWPQLTPVHPSARSSSYRTSPGPPRPATPGLLSTPAFPARAPAGGEAAPHLRGYHAWRPVVAGAARDPHQFRCRSLTLPQPRRRAPRPGEAPHLAVPAAAAPPAPAARGRPRLCPSSGRASPGRRAGRDRDVHPLTSPESRRRRPTQPHQWG